MAIRVNAPYQAVYIHEPLGHEVPALNTPWSVAGLFRFEADVNLNTLIVALYGTTNAASWVGLYMNSDGITCQLEGYNGGSPTVSSSYTLEVGREYRLAIDYNGAGTVRMLLDGAEVLSMAFVPNAGTAGERSLQWGGYGELAGYTDCTIARWRMWTAVLTEAEHRREYRSTVPFRTRNLIHNWPMDAGSGRFDDTMPGEPPLADNPADPCGDGSDFTYLPSILGVPQVVDLGTSATPGARTVNVPQWAEFVDVHIVGSDDTAVPYTDLASIASDFAAAFSHTGNGAIATAAGGWVCTAPVANWAAGRSVTIAFTQANSLAGAHAFVCFIQDTTGVTARGYGQATGDGTTPGVRQRVRRVGRPGPRAGHPAERVVRCLSRQPVGLGFGAHRRVLRDLRLLGELPPSVQAHHGHGHRDRHDAEHVRRADHPGDLGPGEPRHGCANGRFPGGCGRDRQRQQHREQQLGGQPSGCRGWRPADLPSGLGRQHGHHVGERAHRPER
ncbi:LamG-like jellyroll fold domain-containing protein [Hydrogenophaga sp. UC242_50]|uniref:LamG-like jellyroll fold domain-containing protein n=1 Tax=Hydrogenophaga sp. UC242_50 TaxID=3350169 RepID=UPI0036D365C2